MIGEGSLINNRFRLDRLLGRGGFAQVFLATDQVLGRQVAIKVLNPNLGDHEDFDFLGRFQQEARAVAALDHPNVLGVYDYGEMAGTVYLVMPYIDGGSLHDRIAGGRRLPLPEIANYLSQAAAGLDYAHRRGIVHRDIKPQNLLIRAEDNRLLVADFGVAKVLQGGGAQTQTAAIGTISYMAPEQFTGQVSPAIDSYALGCVLFQLLTGRVPYGGPATQAMFSHLNAPIPSVQERSEGRVPASFQPLLDRALAKQPESRYASAGELAQAFEMLAASATTPLPLPSSATTPLGAGGAGTFGTPTPPASLPRVPSAPLSPTVVTPASPTPGPVRPAPPTARRARWLLPGIGALVLVALLASAVLIAGRLPRGGIEATATTGPAPTALAAASITPSPTGAAIVVPTAVPSGLVAPTSTGAAVATAPATARAPVTTTATATARATAAATGIATRPPLAVERGPVFTGHTDHVRAVAWLGEGNRLVSGGGDGAVRLWRTDGALLNTFTGQTFAVTSLAVSPDRTMLAIGSDDRQVHLWRTDGTAVRVLAGHTDFVSSVAWSPDSKQIASGSNDGTVRLWSADGQGARTLTGHTDVVQSVAWSSGGLIASASWDKTIRIWRSDGTLVTTLTGHTDRVFAVAWSPDGQTLASGAQDGTVRLWRADGTPLGTLTGHTGAVSSVAWSVDGALLASGSFDKTVRLWSATGQPLGVIADHTDAVTSVAWGPEPGQLATGSWDKTLRLWRVR